MVVECPECGPTDDVDDDGGSLTCRKCGSVLEESRVVDRGTYDAERSSNLYDASGRHWKTKARSFTEQRINHSAGSVRSRDQNEGIKTLKSLAQRFGLGQELTQQAFHLLVNNMRKPQPRNEEGQEETEATEETEAATEEEPTWLFCRSYDVAAASCVFAVSRLSKKHRGIQMRDVAAETGCDVFLLGRYYKRLQAVDDRLCRLGPVSPSEFLDLHLQLLQKELLQGLNVKTPVLKAFASKLTEIVLPRGLLGKRPAEVSAAALVLAIRINLEDERVPDIKTVASTLKLSYETVKKRVDDFVALLLDLAKDCPFEITLETLPAHAEALLEFVQFSSGLGSPPPPRPQPPAAPTTTAQQEVLRAEHATMVERSKGAQLTEADIADDDVNAYIRSEAEVRHLQAAEGGLGHERKRPRTH